MRQFTQQELANTAWALSILGVGHEPLLESIAASALPIMRLFSAQALANMAWAVAPLRFEAMPLRNALAAASLKRRAHV